MTKKTTVANELRGIAPEDCFSWDGSLNNPTKEIFYVFRQRLALYIEEYLSPFQTVPQGRYFVKKWNWAGSEAFF